MNQIKTYSKKELSDLYGISSKTFRRWCNRANIDIGNGRLLCPKVVQQIFEHLGLPCVEV